MINSDVSAAPGWTSDGLARQPAPTFEARWDGVRTSGLATFEALTDLTESLGEAGSPYRMRDQHNCEGLAGSNAQVEQ